MTKERGVVHVSKNSWHGRWYMYWREHGLAKNPDNSETARNYKENLCHYWRVVVIWVPLWSFTIWNPVKKWVFVTPLSIIVSLTMLGSYAFFWITNFFDTLAFSLILLGVIGFVVGCLWIGFRISQYLNQRKHLPKEQLDSSFVHVTYSWIAAKKHRVCPLIVVNGDEKEAK